MTRSHASTMSGRLALELAHLQVDGKREMGGVQAPAEQLGEGGEARVVGIEQGLEVQVHSIASVLREPVADRLGEFALARRASAPAGGERESGQTCRRRDC